MDNLPFYNEEDDFPIIYKDVYELYKDRTIKIFNVLNGRVNQFFMADLFIDYYRYNDDPDNGSTFGLTVGFNHVFIYLSSILRDCLLRKYTPNGILSLIWVTVYHELVHVNQPIMREYREHSRQFEEEAVYRSIASMKDPNCRYIMASIAEDPLFEFYSPIRFGYAKDYLNHLDAKYGNNGYMYVSYMYRNVEDVFYKSIDSLINDGTRIAVSIDKVWNSSDNMSVLIESIADDNILYRIDIKTHGVFNYDAILPFVNSINSHILNFGKFCTAADGFLTRNIKNSLRDCNVYNLYTRTPDDEPITVFMFYDQDFLTPLERQ